MRLTAGALLVFVRYTPKIHAFEKNVVLRHFEPLDKTFYEYVLLK